ncbi:glycine radical domain-containing protein [Thermodesulfobacteriota bacterium]
MKKLAYLIKTYFRQGGKHIQFNLTTKKILEDVQKYPEKHHALIVRLAGYSAYYVQLTTAMQDDIMARMEYDRAG